MIRATAFIVAVLVTIASIVSAEDLDFDRVKLVQHYPNSRSFLFRTNEPTMKDPTTGKTVFAYNQLMQYFGKRAAAANTTLPMQNVYMVDIALNTVFEHGVIEEMEFFEHNKKLGEFKNWVLVGDVIAPEMVSDSERTEMIKNGTVWKIDKIPSRLETVQRMLLAGPPAGYDALAVFAHCAAGEDRTGEFMLSYELAHGNIFQPFYPSFSQLYAQDCSSLKSGAGRCPSSFSTWGASWYCLTMNYFNASAARTDCMTAYKCKPWTSHCEVVSLLKAIFEPTQ